MHGLAKVITPQGVKQVLNLRWLVRHAYQARRIIVTETKLPGFDCYMTVEGEGWLYETPWESREALLAWIHRRSLRGLPVVYFDERRTA